MYGYLPTDAQTISNYTNKIVLNWFLTFALLSLSVQLYEKNFKCSFVAEMCMLLV